VGKSHRVQGSKGGLSQSRPSVNEIATPSARPSHAGSISGLTGQRLQGSHDVLQSPRGIGVSTGILGRAEPADGDYLCLTPIAPAAADRAAADREAEAGYFAGGVTHNADQAWATLVSTTTELLAPVMQPELPPGNFSHFHHDSLAIAAESSQVSLGLSSPSHSLASLSHYTPVPASRRATAGAGVGSTSKGSRRSKRSYAFEVCSRDDKMRWMSPKLCDLVERSHCADLCALSMSQQLAGLMAVIRCNNCTACPAHAGV
jgi:hypothetical protein